MYINRLFKDAREREIERKWEREEEEEKSCIQITKKHGHTKKASYLHEWEGLGGVRGREVFMFWIKMSWKRVEKSETYGWCRTRKKDVSGKFPFIGKIPCIDFMFIGSSAHRIKLSKHHQIRNIVRKLSHDKNDFLFGTLNKRVEKKCTNKLGQLSREKFRLFSAKLCWKFVAHLAIFC